MALPFQEMAVQAAQVPDSQAATEAMAVALVPPAAMLMQLGAMAAPVVPAYLPAAMAAPAGMRW